MEQVRPVEPPARVDGAPDQREKRVTEMRDIARSVAGPEAEVRRFLDTPADSRCHGARHLLFHPHAAPLPLFVIFARAHSSKARPEIADIFRFIENRHRGGGAVQGLDSDFCCRASFFCAKQLDDVEKQHVNTTGKGYDV
jgi:hypothetical protein